MKQCCIDTRKEFEKNRYLCMITCKCGELKHNDLILRQYYKE